MLVHNRCFVAGTEIILDNGFVKDIENIEVGELILTYNEDTKKHESGTVGELKQHEVDSVIEITLDGDTDEFTIIKTTEEHPFYVIDKGWVKASELRISDSCLKVEGKSSIITNIRYLNESHTVYNLLSVSDNNNFYANGILVHNK